MATGKLKQAERVVKQIIDITSNVAVDETNKCYLEFVEGYLTCTFNHTIGALCLGKKCQYCDKFECSCY